MVVIAMAYLRNLYGKAECILDLVKYFNLMKPWIIYIDVEHFQCNNTPDTKEKTERNC